MQTLDFPTIQKLVQQYAPVIYLEKDEQYFPASIDWYLPLVSLVDTNGKVLKTAPTESDIAAASPSDYLSINDMSSTSNGSLSVAPYYVRFTKVGDSSAQFDIEYWYFYPFNGCSSVGLEFEIGHKRPSVTLPIPPFGEHQGDWEHITVRIDGTTFQVVAVYMAQHGWGSWQYPGKYSVWPGTDRPLVYSAFHSHASYPAAGTETVASVNTGPHDFKLKIGLLDKTDQGTVWDPLAIGMAGVTIASVNVDGVQDPNALWTQFRGHWGLPPDNSEAVHGAMEVIYHIARGLGWPDGPVGQGLKDVLKAILKKWGSTILPGGPETPSLYKGWASGEPTSP